MEKRPRERESESEEETTLAPKRARGGKVIMTDEEVNDYEERSERLAQEYAKEKPKKKESETPHGGYSFRTTSMGGK